MPSKFRVEPVQVSSDLTGVAKFCCGVFFNDVNEPEPFIKIAQIESESNQLFKEKLACMVRAFDGNNLIGYGQINWKGEVLRIESVCVAPTYRRKGVGKAIVESLINLGTTKWDMKSIDLNVEDDNPEAKRFYSSLNFTTIPESQGFGSEMMILDVAQ